MYDHPVFDLAKQEWGTTENPYAAGYILPDGSMLDMGEGMGERVLDHRAVEQFFDADYAERWQPMVKFMEEGAIRMSGHQRENALFLDFVRRPTDAQDNRIRELSRMFEEVTVERTNPDTATVEIWNEWGTPGKARLHPAAVIRWMDEMGMKGLGKVRAPHLTDTIFHEACKEKGGDWQGYKPDESAFILPDGCFVKLDVHKSIASYYPDEIMDTFDVDYQAVGDFIDRGAIRTYWRGDSNDISFEFHKKPTAAQQRIVRALSSWADRIYIESKDEGGAPDGELAFDVIDILSKRDAGRVVRFMNENGFSGIGQPMDPSAGDAGIKWLGEGAYKGLGKVRAPHMTDTLFYQTCKETGGDYQAYEPYDNAFILPDGCLVKLDAHENIASYYPNEIMDTFSREYEAVGDFIERGAIRTHWDGDLNAMTFEFHKKPTAAQQRIVRELSTWVDQVYIDARKEGLQNSVVAFDVIPILGKRDAGRVVRFMNERGFSGLGQPMGPSVCGAGIKWRSIADSIGELRRLYTGFPLPGKPKVKKGCEWALQTAIGKFDEALSYRARGACAESEESAMDAIRYHGVFLGCQTEKKPKKKKRKKKR